MFEHSDEQMAVGHTQRIPKICDEGANILVNETARLQKKPLIKEKILC